ncbi:cyanophycinase [Candidatus Planktophila dulcis]|jgi:cyanophycinase|uniref:Type 1 glutamine amidotransferase-like domain-containing protein n=1 Tax=Candidatus Planktophila dulcis TaxID=1884914 RepID=UPI000BAC973A|nr:Type 1 glutamine amidotransferase-like domain-containing protein [Candidatus Planktophila dulcis]ASY14934.1 cyanophycinase [Candidatus Planktophila dulcis]
MDQNPGAIALVGSGEYSVQMQELETQLLHRAISKGKRNTFIQIPTASSHEGDASREKWKRLGQEQSDRIGSECIYLPIHERDDAFNAEFVDAIKDAGLIYFSGGDPHRVAEIYRNSPVWQKIVEEWRTGTSLAGCSAGAMAFGGSIMGLRRSQHSEGLALLPDIEVIPHYDKMLGWLPDRVAAFIAQSITKGTLLGIDENTALVLTDAWRRYGRGKVHVLRGSLEFEE